MAAPVNENILLRIVFQQSNRIQKCGIRVHFSKIPEFVVERFDGNAIFFGQLHVSGGRNSNRSDNKLCHVGLNKNVVQVLKFLSDFKPKSVE